MVAVARAAREPPPRTTCRGIPKFAAVSTMSWQMLKIDFFRQADGAVIIAMGVKTIVPDQEIRLERHYFREMGLDRGEIFLIRVCLPPHLIDVHIDFGAVR